MLKVGQTSMHEVAIARDRTNGRLAGALLPAAFAVFLGGLILWGVGFAGPAMLHNAAHDARHAHGFPCH